MYDIWKSFCYAEVPLCSEIITIVQKSRAYGYGYYSYKALSLSEQ